MSSITVSSVAAKPLKRIYLSFFETACTGNHVCPGQWSAPNDNARTKDRLPYYLNLARLAEEGKISCVFFADAYGGHDVYQGKIDATLKSGTQVAQLDPMVIIPAMAAATDTVGFAVTGSTSYLNPYTNARTLSTLDHLTNGRLAWNIVTSWSKAAAKALGKDDVIPHDERYVMADEYMDVMYKLWESSWAPDAAIWDEATRTAYDPSKVCKVNHEGKYFKISATAQAHPSPQRTPVLFQAGTSKAGMAFSAKHAECVFTTGLYPSQVASSIAAARQAAADQGRDPASIKFFQGFTPIIGKTLEEAEEKYRIAMEHADLVGALAQFSSYTGVDLSKFPMDEPFSFSESPGEAAVHSAIKNIAASSSVVGPWTPRRFAQKVAIGGFSPAPVGTPEMVADMMEQWIREADVDGFNLSYVSNPGSWEDVVYLLRPELVKRGLMWEDYDVPGGTFRENLQGKGKTSLSDRHYGAKFKYREASENGISS